MEPITPYLDVFISGVPVPQGSLRASRSGHLFYSNASKLTPWRRAMTAAVERALPENHVPIDQAVRVEATFWFPRPKSVMRDMKITAPDTDKLFRAVGDALTDAQIYTDDSRVVAISGSKWYAEAEGGEGVRIKCYILPEDVTHPTPF